MLCCGVRYLLFIILVYNRGVVVQVSGGCIDKFIIFFIIFES